jgi:hypothetical protein
MGPTARLVRLLQIAMLASVALLAVVGELMGSSKATSSTLFYALSLLSISTLGVAFVVRRTLVSPCEVLLRKNPNDSPALTRWKAGYLILYALCEALALCGLILRINGFALSQVWGFYAGGFLLMVLFSPPVSW